MSVIDKNCEVQPFKYLVHLFYWLLAIDSSASFGSEMSRYKSLLKSTLIFGNNFETKDFRYNMINSI